MASASNPDPFGRAPLIHAQAFETTTVLSFDTAAALVVPL